MIAESFRNRHPVTAIGTAHQTAAVSRLRQSCRPRLSNRHDRLPPRIRSCVAVACQYQRRHGGGGFAIISVENLIADRMGQYASGSAPEMIEQERILLSLHLDPQFGFCKNASGQTVSATMPSKISTADSAPDWTGPHIFYKEFAEKIAACRAELGMIHPADISPEQHRRTEARNSGENRTESKKALLKTIEDLRGKWGRLFSRVSPELMNSLSRRRRSRRPPCRDRRSRRRL